MPKASGSPRSTTMTSGLAVGSRASASASEVQCCRTKFGACASLSASLKRRASPALSSTSRMLRCSADTADSVRGQPHQREPEVLDRLDDAQELLQVHRLRDVTVRMLTVGARNVLCIFRSREHDHWDGL